MLFLSAYISLFGYISGMVQWLERHMISCPSKKIFHMDCPGCGLQRSYIALLKGDILESLKLYPAAIPILILFAYTGAHLWFKFENGAKHLVLMYKLCAVIVIVNYIYKIATHQVFY